MVIGVVSSDGQCDSLLTNLMLVCYSCSSVLLMLVMSMFSVSDVLKVPLDSRYKPVESCVHFLNECAIVCLVLIFLMCSLLFYSEFIVVFCFGGSLCCCFLFWWHCGAVH
jgi:hypothetical protein